MHTIDIYRGESLLVTIKPDDNSIQTKSIAGENSLTIVFKDSRNINFHINDWCTVFGERYNINKLPADKKTNKTLYEYTVEYKSEGFDLAKAQFKFLGDDNTWKESNFSFNGKILDFLSLIVANANRVSSGWTIGETIPSDYKNLDFTTDNCYNVLGRIASEFGTEFWIDGKTINLSKKQKETGLILKQGKDRGLYTITRMATDSNSLVTRLYAEGSDKNLKSDYRNFSTRLKMTGGLSYVEQNIAKYGVIEATQVFDDIYPHRTGKLTSADATDPFTFVDSSMDFNVNDYLLPGVTAKVVFNTGQLSGYTFEIASYDNANKRFHINKNKDETSIDVPSFLLHPSIGDEYVLVDIFMPQSYIDAAEALLKQKALEVLAANSEPLVTFSVEIDPVFIKKTQTVLNIGDVVWVTDDELEIDRAIRIVSTTRNIVNEFTYEIQLSDAVSTDVISQINYSVDTNSRDINSVQQQLQNGTIFNNRAVGRFYFQDLPTISSPVGKSPLYLDPTTGELFRLV